MGLCSGPVSPPAEVPARGDPVMNPSRPAEQESASSDVVRGCELLDSVPVVNSEDPLFGPFENDEDWWNRALIAALRFAPPFPLPPVPKPPRPATFFSRRVRARFAKALALWTIADRCVQTLNEVEGSVFRHFWQTSGEPASARVFGGSLDAVGGRCSPLSFAYA